MHDIVIDDIDLLDAIEGGDDAPAAGSRHEAAIATLLRALTIRQHADGSGSLTVVFSLGDDSYVEWHADLDDTTAVDRIVVIAATSVRTDVVVTDPAADRADDDAWRVSAARDDPVAGRRRGCNGHGARATARRRRRR